MVAKGIPQDIPFSFDPADTEGTEGADSHGGTGARRVTAPEWKRVVTPVAPWLRASV